MDIAQHEIKGTPKIKMKNMLMLHFYGIWGGEKRVRSAGIMRRKMGGGDFYLMERGMEGETEWCDLIFARLARI